MSNAVTFDTIRSLANASITSSYVAVGTATTVQARAVCITNATDQDMLFSIDGTNNMLFIAKNSFKLFDISTNKPDFENNAVLPKGTQFYVKYVSAPSTGSVYVEIMYGRNQ